ncbi:MAG: malate:quinone oxidoreductase [Cyclobacteriaceae bacterium]|nr:malate:quinone oxidoreductase [Cyclobacteriaceae bacterium]
MAKITPPKSGPDVVLIGAGIMSATLGVLLKELKPDLTIEIFERLDVAGSESSDAWNNAGTGHSAFCELNYTPQNSKGSIDILKATKIAESFEGSKEFWTYLMEQKFMSNASDFITRVPHFSLVWGDDNVAFLKKRYQLMQNTPLFRGMEYSEDPEKLTEWFPVAMRGRKKNQSVAATRMEIGTDVNFGALTRGMLDYLKSKPGVSVHYEHEVTDLDQQKDNTWEVKVEDLKTDKKRKVTATFVFIGAGGASLHLLEKSDIREGKGFGGFPVGGQWLKCVNPELIEKHFAKVYGKASVGSPPMSVPHVDSRWINGKKELLFGPFAGFSTKFLKNGSFMDLPKSIQLDNVLPMVYAGLRNVDLTKYLIQQVRQTPEDRLTALREYVPYAKMEDWELLDAGQRVQVIKKDADQGGVLEFGTEVVVAEDGSIAALLGASPGASTAVSIMLGLIPKCFKGDSQQASWKNKLKEMVPSYRRFLRDSDEMVKESRERTHKALGISVKTPA